MRHFTKYFPHLLAAAMMIVTLWSLHDPKDMTVWRMEMIWPLGVFLILSLTFGRFRFSNTSYALVSIWLLMHTIGAHYTFADTPCDWLSQLTGDSRNHYDRIAHFAIGLNSFMAAEFFLRRSIVNSRIAAVVFGIITIVSMAGIWEIIEWAAAVIDGGSAGIEFLGAQGDVWDAQKDMLADTLGAILAGGFFMTRKDIAPKQTQITPTQL